jgi:predicted Zn-dependent peptidase
MKVLAAMLGGGTSGRLFRELRERRGLAYALGVLNASRIGPAAFVGYLGTSAANVIAAETGMREELERVRAAPPSDDELSRAKAYVLGTLAMDRRTNARQAWYMAFFEVVGAGWEFPDRYAEAVAAVSPSDVVASARRYLDRPTTVVLVPRDR